MDKIKEIIAKVFKIKTDSITLEMTPNDIESWDSFSQMYLISELEKEFRVVFEFEEIFKITKIKDIYKLLKEKCPLKI